jgi:hypothetical protein
LKHLVGVPSVFNREDVSSNEILIKKYFVQYLTIVKHKHKEISQLTGQHENDMCIAEVATVSIHILQRFTVQLVWIF